MNAHAGPSPAPAAAADAAALRGGVAPLPERVAALRALFERVAHTRMAGLGLLHPGLAVHAEGFEPEADGRCAWGVLLTPWFMNLVRLPIHRDDDASAVGRVRVVPVGARRIEFVGAHEPRIGAFDACSLFSPMFGFADQDGACATARAVLAQLLGEPGEAEALPPELPPPELPPLAPARRAFLFGRGDARRASP